MLAYLEAAARWDQRLAYGQAHRLAWMHPNTITAISFVVAAAAIGALAGGWFVAGSVLFFLQRMLDCIDGEVARRTGRVSVIGSLFDHVTDWFLVAGSLAALAYAFQDTGWSVVALSGAAAVTAMHGIVTLLAAPVSRKAGLAVTHFFPTSHLERRQSMPSRRVKAALDLARADWLMMPLAALGAMPAWAVIRLIGTLGLTGWFVHNAARMLADD